MKSPHKSFNNINYGNDSIKQNLLHYLTKSRTKRTKMRFERKKKVDTMDVSSGTSFKASLASVTVDSTLHNEVGLGRAGTNKCREDTESNEDHQPHCHGLD